MQQLWVLKEDIEHILRIPEEHIESKAQTFYKNGVEVEHAWSESLGPSQKHLPTDIAAGEPASAHNELSAHACRIDILVRAYNIR